MNKNLQAFSILFLGVCILFGSWLISQSLNKSLEKQGTNSEEKYKNDRYEIFSPNESNIIIFDKQSGEYWRKFIESDGGPTNWEKQISPIPTSSN